MKTILLIVLLFASGPTFAVTAIWTGGVVPAQAVTSESGWKCEYRYYGLTFWRVFRTTCPSTVRM
jgi:hypothetical protein